MPKADHLGLPNQSVRIPFSTNLFTTRINTDVFTAIGRFMFNPDDYLLSDTELTIEARYYGCFVENAGNQLEVRIYNVTDAQVVSGSLMSTSSTTPVTLITGNLTFPSGNKEYEVQLRRSIGTGTQNVDVQGFSLIIKIKMV
jgi:hypothetical protein